MTEGRRPLDGRRLLILAAGHFQVPVVQLAKELGCHVVTMDNRPDNPGHRLADESFPISTVDAEDVLRAAAALQLDGVLTYASDVSAPTVAYVAEALGLPGHPVSSARLLQRKDLFRGLQERLGLPHPDFLAVSSVEELDALGGRIPFPALLKPADSSGSKGQTIVGAAAELPPAFEHARRFSRCGVVVVERLLREDLLELVGEVWLRRGRIFFRQYGHNYLSSRVGTARVPIGEAVPGFFGDDVGTELDRQVALIASELGLRSGCLNLDGMVSGGRVHILDVGLRNGGNYLCDLIRLATGVDLTLAAIYSALGQEDDLPIPANVTVRPCLSLVLGAQRSGRFGGVEVPPALRERLELLREFVPRGEQVAPFVSGDRALGILLLSLTSMDELRRAVAEIEDLVKVVVA